jgi:hypothetical protein
MTTLKLSIPATLHTLALDKIMVSVTTISPACFELDVVREVAASRIGAAWFQAPNTYIDWSRPVVGF